MLILSENVTSKDSFDKLELLMNSRNLNRTQTAKILGVEPWTVGAWLAGKREISAKYKEKINELISLPLTSDLLIAPTVNQLIKQINQVEDESDAAKVTDALAKIIKEASYKLGEFSVQSVDESIISAFRKMLETYDNYSLAQINQLMTEIISERILVSSISSVEYAKKCIELSEKDKLNNELFLDLDSERLYASYSVTFYDNEDLISAKSSNDNSRQDLRSIQYELEDEARLIAENIFRYTAFEMDSINDQWTSDDTYYLPYHISLNHPQFKESLRLLMNRCVHVKDWIDTSSA